MKHTFLTGVVCLLTNVIWAQSLTQTVRGTVKDLDNQMPLIGASVIVVGSDPIQGTTTDIEGKFRLDNMPTGRIALQFSYIGYEPSTMGNIVVNTGKEVVLNVRLQESAVKMEEVVVTASSGSGEAVNEMAMVSARSISPEVTTRMAGSFNDPSRVIANYAGVTATQDGSNDIIVRGNSPKYVQWRLEGIQITNPNHFGDQSAVGGAISALNNNLLATSDFYTGAFTAEYGDVLSGVYDVKLRAGNNEKTESVFGFGLLGTDFTFEGPFKKGYNGSYLLNYRYSTVTMINALGLLPDDVSGVPKFQDGAFKINLPTKKAGNFSLFGLGGFSKLYFEDITPALWETPGDRGAIQEIREDFGKTAYLANVGLNHSYTINRNSFFTTNLSYSGEGIRDRVYELTRYKIYGEGGVFVKDSAADKTLNFKTNLKRSTYRAALTYHRKLNANHKIQVGSKYALFAYDFEQSMLDDSLSSRTTLVDMDENMSTIRNFVSWKYRVNNDLTIIAGLHNMNVLYNNKSTLEPRVALDYQLPHGGALQFGYGKHSTMESVHNYFTRVHAEDGSFVEPNKNLDLLKAHHFVLGYRQNIFRDLSAKIEFYYQGLYDLPVENNDTSYYATINEGLEFRYVDLVNKGTGKNYGVELTLERPFKNNYYYLINGSLYQSKYESLEGRERNTQYNGNYLVNVIFGKEFLNLGRKHNQTLGINAKVFFGGGRKIIPLLRDEQGNLAVNPEKNEIWDYEQAYDRDIEDLHMVILSATYKWNRPKATHELMLSLDNLTNSKGKIREYYDESEPGSIGYLTQFGLFPNLMYRVYF